MPPEMIQKLPYDHRLDIWGLGILLFELIHGYTPFKADSSHETFKNIVGNNPIEFDEIVTIKVKNLINSILRRNPKERYTLKQIFQDPWMIEHEDIYNMKISDFIHRDHEGEKIRKNKKKKKTEDKIEIKLQESDLLSKKVLSNSKWNETIEDLKQDENRESFKKKDNCEKKSLISKIKHQVFNNFGIHF